MEHVNAICVAAFEAVCVRGRVGSLQVIELQLMLVSQGKLRQHLLQNVEGNWMSFHGVSSQRTSLSYEETARGLMTGLHPVVTSYLLISVVSSMEK